VARIARTVTIRSPQLPRKVFRVFVELEALKHREMRGIYPHLPSHYIYTACQDTSTGAKSFLKPKKLGLT